MFRLASKSRIARNAASGFAAMVFLSALSLVTIPLYVRLLGKDQWGIIAACASLQMVFSFVDSGFSQIVPRWVAQHAGDAARLRGYTALFARTYLAMGAATLVALQLGANALATSWFKVPTQSVGDMELAVRLIALQLAFQFLNSLSISVWGGLQQQWQSSWRTCLFAALKHGVALTALLSTGPRAWAYAAAFASVSLAELLINASAIRRQFPALPATAARPSQGYLPLLPFWREVSLMSMGVVVGLAASQLDRVVLSRSASVAEFGVYVVVANLAFAFLQLPAPLARAFFPRLVNEVAAQGAVTRRTFGLFAGSTIVAGALPAMVASLYADALIAAWLHDPHFVVVGTIPLRLLLWSVAINVCYGCIYQLIVAHGKSRLVLRFNLVALAFGCLVVLVDGAGESIVLGGHIWLASTSTQLFLGLSWLLLQRPARAPAAELPHG